MDYRKSAVFGQNWSSSRYQVLPYFAVEKEIFLQNPGMRVLDLGCANGWNMSRFNQYVEAAQNSGKPFDRAFGLDPVPERVKLAGEHGSVMVASGLDVPTAGESFDLVYIQHVLHHIGDVNRALSEAKRVLKPGGLLFLVETVEDSPIIHWGRRMYPKWLGDEINAPFTYSGLQEQLSDAGFQLLTAEQYSVLFWIWEIFPDQIPAMEKLTPLFVHVEKVLLRFLRSFGAHCFLVARKIG